MALHILEEADVLRVDGEIAWIDPERRSTCSGCSAKNGCGTGTLAKVLGNRRVEMRAINHIGAKPGDRVVVGVAGAALLRGSVAVYVVPLLLFFALALFGQHMAANLQARSPEFWTILSAFFGLSLGFLWVRLFSKRIRLDARYQPVLLRIVGHKGFIPIRSLQ